jgi:curved DNA-binding protein CbpA
MTEFDPYAVLRVAPDAPWSVVQAAYRALARIHHPDLAGDAGIGEMRRINAAWEMLRDPKRRAAYDAKRAGTSDHTGTRSNAHDLAAHDPHTSPPGSARWPGRSSTASAESPRAWRRGPGGMGAAGPPPGRPSGSVLQFGRFIGWSLGEIARADPGYLEWLEDRREGRPYAGEIDTLLKNVGYRHAPEGVPTRARGRRRLFGTG